MKNLEELKEQYKKLGAEIEKLEKGNTSRWKPKEGEKYWCIDSNRIICNSYWKNDEYDNWRYINYNTFKTEEDAQEYKDYILAKAEYTYEFTREEWKDTSITKYLIYYGYYINKIDTYCTYSYFSSKLYFKTPEKAQEFIDKYKKQILKFEFGIEEE